MLDLITITETNAHWAINENLARVYREINFKFCVYGTTVLLGDLDFQSLYTIRGVSPNGSRTALSRAPYTRE